MNRAESEKVKDLSPAGLVAESPWFQDLPQEALAELTAAAGFKDLPVGSYIYEQGRPTTEIFCVVEGRVRVSLLSPNGHEFALIEREPGTWFGEPGLVSDEGRIIEATAIEFTRLLVIPRDVVLSIGGRYPRMYENLFRYSQGILRSLHELIGGILFYPLKARVAFARLALGSRQRVNRVFRDWASRGLVEMRADHIWVRDLDQLEQEIDLFE